MRKEGIMSYREMLAALATLRFKTNARVFCLLYKY